MVTERCPQAVRCADPFHIVQWATEALDEVRRAAWNDARNAAGGSREVGGTRRRYRASSGVAQHLWRARWALWKNPEDLTVKQREKLNWIATTDPRLYRAYLLKEGLRTVFKLGRDAGKEALQIWLGKARRSRIPQFVQLQQRIVRQLDPIHASLEHGLSNARTESVNTKIRLITRMAFGFHNPHALIALAMLALGGYRPDLPGRK